MACGPYYYYPLPTGCGGGSTPGEDPCCGNELAAFPNLNVTIPDGPDMGVWTVTWMSDIDGDRWENRAPITPIFLACIDGAMTMGTSIGIGSPAEAFDCNPLLFTFDGAPWGSTGDITVELA